MRGPGNRWGRWGRPLGMGAGHGLRALLRRENHFDRSDWHSIGFQSKDGDERFLAASRGTAIQIGIWTTQPRRWEHSTITDAREFRSGALWAGGARKMSKFGGTPCVARRAWHAVARRAGTPWHAAARRGPPCPRHTMEVNAPAATTCGSVCGVTNLLRAQWSGPRI